MDGFQRPLEAFTLGGDPVGDTLFARTMLADHLCRDLAHGLVRGGERAIKRQTFIGIRCPDGLRTGANAREIEAFRQREDRGGRGDDVQLRAFRDQSRVER